MIPPMEQVSFLQVFNAIFTCSESTYFCEGFKFSAHKDELIVGNVFVRIFNQMPMFQLEVKFRLSKYNRNQTLFKLV